MFAMNITLVNCAKELVTLLAPTISEALLVGPGSSGLAALTNPTDIKRMSVAVALNFIINGLHSPDRI
jgi:hypothetical protein